MKIEVRLPDELLKRMHDYSERYEISLDDLVSNALREYLDAKDDPDDEVTSKLNEFYSNQKATLDPVIIHLASLSLPDDKW